MNEKRRGKLWIQPLILLPPRGATQVISLNMDDEEEKLFLERLPLKVWKARREGPVIGAAYISGVGLLLYLITDLGPLDPMSWNLFWGRGAP